MRRRRNSQFCNAHFFPVSWAVPGASPQLLPPVPSVFSFAQPQGQAAALNRCWGSRSAGGSLGRMLPPRDSRSPSSCLGAAPEPRSPPHRARPAPSPGLANRGTGNARMAQGWTGQKKCPQRPGSVLTANRLQTGAERRERLLSIDANREKLPVIIM